MNQHIPDTEGPSEFFPDPSLADCLEEIQLLLHLARQQAPASCQSLCRYLHQTDIRLRWLQARLHFLGLVPLTSRRLGLFLQSLRSPPPGRP